MYNMAVHCQQVLTATVLSVSVTETDDAGNTHVLFTCQGSADDRNFQLEVASLEEFLDQSVLGLSRALSTTHHGSSGPSAT